ncbi:hypothetical protein, variant [Aphanomyces invadans]|uniref:Vesicle tethering protein Uso1/P115-like head domain-containing protein n=1 Tax=Aphanomyces invadans TaxID=157072 RepID=A0A024USL7_9STRA|nr:hypothetical protein, variant [Aphanomyces invadans]ETW09511.1 hypothetical protein, variant [Aphanomyces invadans]|eukprot:XP_008860922.1 hypothetical protein, variant [Aphanomyces invadans]
MINIMKRFVESSVNQAVSDDAPTTDDATAMGMSGESGVSLPPSSIDPPQSTERPTPRVGGVAPAPTSRERTPSSTVTLRRSVPKADLVMAIERFQYAMLLAERKTAVGQLQKLWADADIPDEAHRLIIPVILNALVTDPRDTELMEAMLELMQSIVTVNPSNATFLLQEPHALDTILGLMQDPSPWIRGPTVQLIKRVQDGDSSSFATHILACQEGLRLLLEVVEDKREHIRDTAVQILLSMTLNQTPMTLRHVQQFLAFEDGFTRLFQIVDLELDGHGMESAVLADSLHVILNMVRNNTMTQSLLRETPFIPVLFPLLLEAGLPPSPSDQRADHDDAMSSEPAGAAGLDSALEILASVVGPVFANTPPEELDEIARRDQTKRHDERGAVQAHLAALPEVVQAVGEVACRGVSLADRKHAIQVLHLLCDENDANQVMALTLTSMTGPTPMYVLSMCLALDVHHEETPLGASARTLLDNVWYNDLAKISILQHIHVPPPHEAGAIEPVGQALIKRMATTLDALVAQSTAALSLTPKDAAKIVWKCCARWRSLLHNNECKLLALRVPAPHATHAVSGSCFLTACVKWVVDMPRTKAHYPVLVGLFRLVLGWVHGCGPAIQEIVTSIPTLTFLCQNIDKLPANNATSDQIEVELAGLSAMMLGVCLDGLDGKSPVPLTKEQVLGWITRQVGLQKFTDAFGHMQQLSTFQNSSTRTGADGVAAVYDKTFVQWFKHVADTTRVGILNVYMGAASSGGTVGDDSRSRAYQDLIRMQDQQLHALQEQVRHLTTGGAPAPSSLDALENELASARTFIADLKQAQDHNESRIRGLAAANDLVERELQRKEAELKTFLQSAKPPSSSTLPASSSASLNDRAWPEEHQLRMDQLENDLRRLQRQLQDKDDELDGARHTIELLSVHQSIVSTAHVPTRDQSVQVDGPDETVLVHQRVATLERELQEAHDMHRATVSTLVARHEQAAKEWESDASAKLNQALQAQAARLDAQHQAQVDEWNVTRVRISPWQRTNHIDHECTPMLCDG